MKIALLVSVKEARQYTGQHTTILNILTKQGHIVSHMLAVTEEILDSWSLQKRKAFYYNFYKEINKSDLIVAECSFPSLTIGYEISNAIQQGKDVIILKSDSASIGISANDPLYLHKNIYVYEYTTNSLKQVLTEALQLTNNESHKKFNILLPIPMVTKLNKISKQKSLPKSVYIRSLIEQGLAQENVE